MDTKIPTPRLSHLSADDLDLVYEPAEDTFSLLDALEQDAEDLKTLVPSICLEIGQAFAMRRFGQILGSSSTLYLCTDINPHACKCTYRTGIENKIPLNPINTSFALPFHSRLAHVIDVILFNPPYVPTISSEVTQAQDVRGIAGSWAGGSDGMQVTNYFLDMVDDLLSPRGRFYLVAVKENNIPEIQRRMFDTYGLESSVVLSRRAGREHLSVLRFTRKNSR